MNARLRHLVTLAALGAAACGAPSSYDGLTGGAKEDANLEAPRPMAPLSVTMVSTSRPKIRWELFGQETGAVVEMSRKRDFAAGAVKTFTAEGRELVVPEDLEPGIWFWRLRARGKGTVGTKTSPTWEVLVRGPAARGSSDIPTGSVVDIDGDGEPDLVTAGDAPEFGVISPVVLVFRGVAGGGFDANDPQLRGPIPEGAVRERAAMSVAAGLDVDGDGFGDLAYTGLVAIPLEPGLNIYDVTVERGGPYSNQGMGGELYFPLLPLYPGAVPSLAIAGDVNGDGFGDLVAADPGNAISVFGARKGPAASALVSTLPQLYEGAPARAVHGGFDLNGDGFADLVMGPPAAAPQNADLRAAQSKTTPGTETGLPIFEPRTATFALGTGDLTPERPRELGLAQAADVQARAFTSADFDGDGLADIAASVGERVCVWFGSRDKGVTPGPCVIGLDGDAAFGESLTAGDVDGDGFDEIIATARKSGTSELRVVRVADATPTVTPFGKPGFGTRVTTIWPGRPGKARFAAVADGADAIGVFEGGELVHSIPRPRMIREDFGRALR